MATTVQALCDVCDVVVKDEVAVLTGWLEEVTLCAECEEDFQAWMEADDQGIEDAGEKDTGGDIDMLEFPQDTLPYPVDSKMNSEDEKIQNIAARIIDNDELFTDEKTWIKYGVADMETKNKITKAAMEIMWRGME